MKKKILIVEDQSSIAASLERILKNSGYDASYVTSGKAAVKKALEENPDLILMDVELQPKGMTGIEATKRIHKHSDIPVVYLTGHSDKEKFNQAKETEPFGYLLKPFDPKEINFTIETALYKHGIDKQLRQSREELEESEEKYRTMFQNIPGMIYKAKPDWSTEIISKSKVISGYSAQDFNTQKINWLDIIYPDDKKRVFEEAAPILENPMELVQEYRIITKKGKVCWVEDHKTSHFTKDGVFNGVDGVVFDIAKRKKIEEALEKQTAYLDQLFESAPEGIVMADSSGKVLRVNKEFLKLFGYSRSKILGSSLDDLIASKDLYGKASSVTFEVAGGKEVSFEALRKRKDGTLVEVSILASPIKIGNKLVAVYGIYRDISERKRYEEKLHELSVRDPLTGLYNRRGFFEQGKILLDLTERINQNAHFIYLDVDKFKEINDTYGHEEGDKVLEIVSGMLTETFRKTDIIARFGGDELAVLAMETNMPISTEGLVDRVYTKLDALNKKRNKPYNISLSVGVAQYIPDRKKSADRAIEELITKADNLMYINKERKKIPKKNET